GLGLVIGGALGNVIDRAIYGAVADFFRFHAFGYDWYVFNVADAAITVGVVALLLDAFARPEAKNSDREPATPKETWRNSTWLRRKSLRLRRSGSRSPVAPHSAPRSARPRIRPTNSRSSPKPRS